MATWSYPKIQHKRQRTNAASVRVGFVQSARAYWSPKREVIQCYATVNGHTVWVARVDLRPHDPILKWPDDQKEARFTEALSRLLPCSSVLSYTCKPDRRTQQPVYFAEDISFDGFELCKKVDESLVKSS